MTWHSIYILYYLGLDNTCYPETLGKMLVINAPFLAVQTWGAVRRLLDPRTQGKIEVSLFILILVMALHVTRLISKF